MNSGEILERLNAGISARYAIEREIGAGGMATVFLARDLRHERPVAFKVLNPELGAILGAERFLSEIRVTANLQHPNLLPLFDSGETDGLLYYVMPFVEGESLRARLDRERQLPVDEAVRMAVLIAGALDYAHGEGVIHRDLKPENILLSRGQPLLADFGIALAVSLAGGARVTQTGLSLGTPQYMSPEQATGDRQIDGRTDVYSLAAVLYEMLSGDPPHNASTVQAVIAKVLTEQAVSVRVSRPNVPEHVDAAIMCALEKLPADRIASAREFAEALEGRTFALPVKYAAASRSIATAHIVPTWRDKAREPLTLVLFAVTAASLAVAAWNWGGHAAPEQDGPTVRFMLEDPDSAGRLAGRAGQLAISPDGKNYAYLSAGGTPGGSGAKLYLRASNSAGAIQIPGTDGSRLPAFSPNGKWMSYFVQGQLFKMSLDGFRSTKVAELPVGSGAIWATDEMFVVPGSTSGLSTLSTAGGELQPLTELDSAAKEINHGQPKITLDGRRVVFVIRSGATAAPLIGTVSLKTRKRTLLPLEGFPVGFVDNYLVYATEDGSLFAIEFDAANGTVRGNSVLVGEGVRSSMQPRGGRAGPPVSALSRSGTLIYQSVGVLPALDLITVDFNGRDRVVIPASYELSDARYSPNGRRIAYTVGRSQDATEQIWIYDLVSGTRDPLARDGRSFRPEWSPDGKRILFNRTVNGREELWWQLADGSAPAELLQSSPNQIPQGFISRDSKWLIYRTGTGPGSDTDIWYRALSGDTTAKSVSAAKGYLEMSPTLSPDGRWLAYSSNEKERTRHQIYVREFPGPGARYPVSIDGGTEPLWSRDSKTLYYRAGPTITAATIVTAPEFTVTNRRVVFTGLRDRTGANHRQYDLSPDEKEFLLIRAPIVQDLTLMVVHNWAAEVRARMAGGKRPRD